MSDLNARVEEAERALQEQYGGSLQQDITLKLLVERTVRDPLTDEVSYVTEVVPDSEYEIGNWSDRGLNGKRYRVMQPKRTPVAKARA